MQKYFNNFFLYNILFNVFTSRLYWKTFIFNQHLLISWFFCKKSCKKFSFLKHTYVRKPIISNSRSFIPRSFLTRLLLTLSLLTRSFQTRAYQLINFISICYTYNLFFDFFPILNLLISNFWFRIFKIYYTKIIIK